MNGCASYWRPGHLNAVTAVRECFLPQLASREVSNGLKQNDPDGREQSNISSCVSDS